MDVSSKLLNYLEKKAPAWVAYGTGLALPPHENAHRILTSHYNKPGAMSQINTSLSKKQYQHPRTVPHYQ